MTTLDRYLHYAKLWLELTPEKKSGNEGKSIRATVNTCWFLLQDEQESIDQAMRPETLFKGYKT